MPGFVTQASFAILIAILFAPAGTSAQSSTQSVTTPPAKPGSVLDRIRRKMKDTRRPKDKAEQWFEPLDTDKNDEITKNELFESIRKRFDAMDVSKDKFVSKSEYLQPGKNQISSAQRFGGLDSNSDGRLSMSEFASPANWRFDRIDRNLDGKISRQEAARLFDRPVGKALPDEDAECFYVDRQVIRVKKEVAESFRKRGFPKADCQWTPEVSDELKTKKFVK